MMVIGIFASHGILQRICTSPNEVSLYVENLVDLCMREPDTKLEVYDTHIKVGNGENVESYTFQGIFLDDDMRVDLNKSIINLLVRRFRSRQWLFENVCQEDIDETEVRAIMHREELIKARFQDTL